MNKLLAQTLDLSSLKREDVLSFEIPEDVTNLNLDTIGLTSHELSKIKLPTNLQFLSLAFNRLTNIPKLPDSLTTLVLSENPITNKQSFIELPKNLKNLEIVIKATDSSNFFIGNVIFPDSLEILTTNDFTDLIRLKNLPKNLNEIRTEKVRKASIKALKKAHSGNKLKVTFINLKKHKVNNHILSWHNVRSKNKKRLVKSPKSTQFLQISNSSFPDFKKFRFNQGLRKLQLFNLTQSASNPKDLALFDFPGNLESLKVSYASFTECKDRFDRPDDNPSSLTEGLPSNLQELDISYACVKLISLPVSLNKLVYAGNAFIEFPDLPEDLEYLDLSDNLFNANNIEFPNNLKTLILRSTYTNLNTPMVFTNQNLPRSIESLDLASNNLLLSPSFFNTFNKLKKLDLGFRRGSRTIDIASFTYPNSLETLILKGGLIQNSINQLRFPDKLKSLSLTSDFTTSNNKNEDFADFSSLNLPETLETLTLDIDLNNPGAFTRDTSPEDSFKFPTKEELATIKFPNSLKKLTLQGYFRSLEGLKLPNQLKELRINSERIFVRHLPNFDISTARFPESLEILVINDVKLKDVDSANFGTNLKYLSLASNKLTSIKPSQLPTNLAILDLRRNPIPNDFPTEKFSQDLQIHINESDFRVP